MTLVGPTTLAAVVNSLQMGFRTLVIQKQTSQVWRLVAQINTDLGAFQTAVERAERSWRKPSPPWSPWETVRGF